MNFLYALDCVCNIHCSSIEACHHHVTPIDHELVQHQVAALLKHGYCLPAFDVIELHVVQLDDVRSITRENI